MEEIVVEIINYIYMLGAFAFVMEYLVSREKGDALALKLIDWSDFLYNRKVDKLISKVALSFSEKYDQIYGKKYFGKREWIASSVIAFTYCYIFYLFENGIGFDSTLAKQLGYWFVPNLIADIISINFTRWLLKRIHRNPGGYVRYLLYDFVLFVLCFYICFSFTMIYLYIFSDYGSMRVLLHPFYLLLSAIENFPDPMAVDAILILMMASTTLIPTLLHVLLLVISLLIKFLIPFLRVVTHSMIEKMISFENHPVGVAVIICGLFLLPFIITVELLL